MSIGQHSNTDHPGSLKLHIASLIVALLCLSLLTGCEKKRQAGKNNQGVGRRAPDTGKILAKLRQFDQLKDTSMVRRLAVLESIRQEAIAMEYNDQACLLSMDIARFYTDRGNFDSSLRYYKIAKPYCDRPLFDKTLPAVYLTEFGGFYHDMRADYISASKCYYEALNYLSANKITDNELLIVLYTYLHMSQMKLGHSEQAFTYLKQGEEVAKRLKLEQGLAIVWSTMGDFYASQKDYEVALGYYDSAIKREKIIWDPNIFTAALMGKGNTLLKAGRASEAASYFEKAIKAARRNKIVYTEASALIALGDAYNAMGRFNEAITLLTSRPELPDIAFNNDKKERYRVLMRAHEGLGQHKLALEYQRQLNQWNDSLSNVEKAVALSELEVKFQTANKDKDIAAKRLQIEQQRNNISQKNSLITVITAISLAVVVGLVALYKNLANKQKLQRLKLETLQNKQEVDLLRSAIEGEEQERKRLSRELHDGIGSMISSAIFQLSLFKKKNGATGTKDVEDVLQLLQETSSEIRKTAHNILPDIVYRQSLYEAVKNYCHTVSQGTALTIDVQFYGDDPEFPPKTKLAIYRVIQELVHNILKHAKATHAIVQAVLNEDQFSITVEDNGTGFDVHARRAGVGIENVRSRIKSLYGAVQFESTPGQGATVYIEFDYNKLLNEPSAER